LLLLAQGAQGDAMLPPSAALLTAGSGQ